MVHRSTEDRYRALFNVIPQGVIVYDIDGVMIEANEAAAEIIGADMDEIIGHNTREANWPAWTEDGDALPWAERPLAITLRTGEPVGDFVFGVNRVDDGEPRWIRASTEPIFDESGELVAAVASVTDITDQRVEKRQLQESRERLQAIIDASPPGIITVDMQGIVTSWSPSAERIFGWSADEVIGEFNPTVSEEMREFYLKSIREWDHRGTGESEEIAVLCKNGSTTEIAISVAPLYEGGEQVGVVGIMEDISDRKRAEEREREQREYLEALRQSSPLPIITIDIGGCVTSWNRAAEELFGWSEDEVLGKQNPIITGKRRESHRELLHQVALDEWSGGPKTIRADVRCRDGRILPLEVTVDALRDAEGDVRGLIGTHRDLSARLEAEKKRREQRHHLEAILSASPFAIITLDLEGIVTSWNPAAEELFGWTAEEAVGRPHPSIAPEKRELLATILADLRAGSDPLTSDTEGIHKDGTRMPIQGSIAPLHDASGEVCGAVGIHQDITERKEAEERLRESRARYRSLFEHSPVGIWELDISTVCPTLEMLDANTVQGYADSFARREDLLIECIESIEVRDANQAVLTMHGVSDLEELLENYESLISATGEQVMGEGLALLATGWSVFDLKIPLLTLEGDRLDVLARVQVAPGHDEELDRVLVSVLDITELEEAREELQHANQLLEATLSSMDQAVLLQDSHRRVTLCNDAASDVFGCTAEDLENETLRRFYPSGEEYERLGRRAKQILSRGETFECEQQMLRADGTGFLAAITASSLDRSQGWLGGVVSVVRDITQRRDMQERLAQSRRMEAVGKLAGGVAHDFNNMLTVILGNLSMALREFGGSDEIREQMSQSLEASRRAAKLTDQLLAFSRKQMLAPETVDLDDIIRELERLLQRTIPESIDLQVSLHADRPVYFDPAQIDQIVMNLVMNARDAMPEGGTLTVETEDVRLDEGAPLPPEMAPGDYVRMSIADTGMGMDEETAARVFEPFFTGREDNEGTGLGLSTVYGLLQQGGGGIEVSSTPGEGTCFDVYLPVSEDDTPVRPERREMSTTPANGETVLVAEDDAAVRRLVVSVLQSNGYDVVAGSSGSEARRLFDDNSESVDLLVTDVVMPGTSGAQLARKLRQVRRDLPVLYISGYTGDVLDDHGLAGGSARLLHKPFTPEDLLREVKQMLAGD